jgi:hypothetical protein
MRTQSQFLRLRRTKIGLRDFRTVKVIGKGAFGEVSISILGSLRRLPLRRRLCPTHGVHPLMSSQICHRTHGQMMVSTVAVIGIPCSSFGSASASSLCGR